MITNLILNKREILENSAKYYVGKFAAMNNSKRIAYVNAILRNTNYVDLDSLKPVFTQTNFTNILSNSILSSSKYNFAIVKYQMYLYYFHELINRVHERFNDYLEVAKDTNLKVLSDYRYLNNKILESQIKREKQVSSVMLINDFKDSGMVNLGNLKDPKTGNRFFISNTLDTTNETLNLRKTFESIIKVKSVNINFSESTYDSKLSESIIDNPNDLVLTEDPWRCLIGLKDTSNCTMSLIFVFENYERINSFNIQYGSLLDIYIEENGLSYLNSNNEWIELQIYNESINDTLEIYFETVYTKKIKINFKQDQVLESKKIQTHYYNFFDMSINSIKFKYSCYSNYGIFRSSEYLIASKPLSLDYNCSYLYKDQDVYTEMYLKIKGYSNESDGLRLKVDTVIPYPEVNYQIKELISFKDKFAKLSFVPKEDTIRLFVKGNPDREILFGSNTEPTNTQFQIKDDSDSEIRSVVRNNQSTLSGEYYIYFLRVQYNREYYVTYDLYENDFSLDSSRNLVYSNNQLTFQNSYKDYYYAINPILILKTKTNRNDSTSIIDSIVLLCEEQSTSDGSVLDIQNQIKDINKDDGYVFV
jgi:hypothetical protein